MTTTQIEFFWTDTAGAEYTRKIRRCEGTDETRTQAGVTLTPDPLAYAYRMLARAERRGWTNYMIVEFPPLCGAGHDPMEVWDGEGHLVTMCRRCAENLEEAR